MKNFLQNLILIFLVFLVWFLGFFAYKSATDTLIFAFANQHNQSGKEMIITFDRPGKISKIIPSWNLVDSEAIKKSLYYNWGLIFPDRIGDFDLVVGKDFIKIFSNKFVDWDEIYLSSIDYNNYKNTSYRIPNDVYFNYISDKNDFFEISEKWNPKDNKFEIKILDSNIKIEDFVFYEYYPVDWICFSNDFLWDSEKYKKIQPKNITISENSYILDIFYNSENKNQCLIAGYSNQIIPVIDRILDDFSFSWESEYVLNSSDNLKSKISFNSSSKLLTNISKKNLLNKISISPSVDFTENDITIFDDKITITWEFIYWQEYNIYLTDVEDIFGRKKSYSYEFKPENSPFLNIKLNNWNKSNFLNSENINFQILHSNSPKWEIELKLCRLNPYSWAYFSDIIAKNSKNYNSKIFDILSSDYTSNCQKSEINLPQNSMIMDFSLKDIFQNYDFSDGLYSLTLRNYGDSELFDNFISPQIFSITKNKIIFNIFDDNSAEIKLIDVFDFSWLLDYEMEVVTDFDFDNNKYDSKKIWKTDKNWIIKIDNIKDFPRKWYIFAKWFWNLSFIEFDTTDSIFKNNNFNILTDKNVYNPLDSVKIFTFIDDFYKNNDYLVLKIIDNYGVSYYNSVLKLDNSNYITTNFDLPDYIGNFTFSIENEKTWEILAQKIIKSIPKIQQNLDIIADFRVLESENNILQNIRKIKNTNEEKPWYEFLFTAPVTVDSIVKIQNSSSEFLKNTHFSYVIKRIQNNETEIIKEWKWVTWNDEMAYIRVNDTFSTTYEDVKYVLDISIIDPINWENIIKSFEQKVGISDEYKIFDDKKSIKSKLSKNIYNSSDKININSEIDNSFFVYEVIKNSDSSIVSSGVLLPNIELDLSDFDSWKYFFKTFAKFDFTEKIPPRTISQIPFFIEKNSEINIDKLDFFTDKNYYFPWEKIEFSFIFPQKNNKLILSNIEKIFTNKTIFTENQIANFEFDIPENFSKDSINFDIFYLEDTNIITQKISIPISHTKNNKKFLNIKDFQSKNFKEFSIKDDELKNIKYTIISIFEKDKNIFTDFVIPKDSQVFSKIPDLKTGDYLLQVIFVKNDFSTFLETEKFSIKSDFSVNINLPKNVFQLDNSAFDIQVYNNSDTIFYSDVFLEIWNSESQIFSGSIIANVNNYWNLNFPFKISNNWLGEIPYKIIFKKNNEIIKTENWIFNVSEIPSTGLSNNIIGYTTGSIDFLVNKFDNFDSEKSNIEILASNSPLIFVPKILKDLENMQKTNIADELDLLILKLKNNFNINDISLEFNKILQNQSIDKWQKLNKFSDSEILNLIFKIQKIQKLWIQINEKFVLDYKKFIKNIDFENLDLTDKIVFLKIFYILNSELDNEKLQQIIVNLSVFSDYINFLDLSKIANFDILPEILEKVDLLFDDEKNKISSKIFYLRFLLENWKKDIFDKNFAKFNIANFSNLYNFSDKNEAVLFLLEYSKFFEIKKTNISISSDWIFGSQILDVKNPNFSWKIEKNKIFGDIILKTNYPVFYSFNQNNFLNAPALFPEKISKNLKISKKIFFINENAWQDWNGEYFVQEKLENWDFLQIWKLYKTEVEVEILDFETNSDKNLELRHILPNWAELFFKEKEYPKISKKIWNTIFVNFGEPKNKKLKFYYYFKPKISGNYLFPATFWYFVDDRQNYANDSHFYLHFK